MRDIAIVVSMFLAACLAFFLVTGCVTGFWHLAAAVSGYGALLVVTAGTIWAAGWAGVVWAQRAVRRALDRRENG